MAALETLPRRMLPVDDFHRMGEAAGGSGDVSTAGCVAVLSPLLLADVRLDIADLWRR